MAIPINITGLRYTSSVRVEYGNTPFAQRFNIQTPGMSRRETPINTQRYVQVLRSPVRQHAFVRDIQASCPARKHILVRKYSLRGSLAWKHSLIYGFYLQASWKSCKETQLAHLDLDILRGNSASKYIQLHTPAYTYTHTSDERMYLRIRTATYIHDIT